VRYRDLGRLQLNEPAVVSPIDHPSPLVSNAVWVLTTPVQRIDWWNRSGPEFETANSRYIPWNPWDETLAPPTNNAAIGCEVSP